MKSKVLILFVVLLVGFGTAGFAGGNQQSAPPTMPERIAVIPQSSSWTAITGIPFGSIKDIAYGNGKFVAVGCSTDEKEGRMAYSTDGINWTAVQDSPFSSATKYKYYYVRTVSYGNGRFVAGGYFGNSSLSLHVKIAYSSDGVTWTEAADSTFGSTWINRIVYGGSAGQEKFIAGGGNGKMAYSTDGITWTAITNSRLSGGILVYYAGDKWFASGKNGQIAYSADGITWTAVPNSPFGTDYEIPANVAGIAYGNGKFVAVGYKGVVKGNTIYDYYKIVYSTDGIDWTEATDITGVNRTQESGNNVGLYSVAYGNGKFVAAGEWGVTASSTDGVSWKLVRINEELGFRRVIWSVVYGGGKWVLGSVYDDGVMAWSTTGE